VGTNPSPATKCSRALAKRGPLNNSEHRGFEPPGGPTPPEAPRAAQQRVERRWGRNSQTSTCGSYETNQLRLTRHG